jgi:hypothetical protein
MDPFTNVLDGNFQIRTLLELSRDDYLLNSSGKPVKIASIVFKKQSGVMIKQEIGESLLLAKNVGYTNTKIKISLDVSINYGVYRDILKREYSKYQNYDLTELVSIAAATIDMAEYYNGFYSIPISLEDSLTAIVAVRTVGMIAKYEDDVLYFTGKPMITTLLPRKNNIVKEFYNVEIKDINDIDTLVITLAKDNVNNTILLDDFTPINLTPDSDYVLQHEFPNNREDTEDSEGEDVIFL